MMFFEIGLVLCVVAKIKDIMQNCLQWIVI